VSVLYIVATPIGNLEDISLRALRILGEVKLIAAEDTRTTRRLLTRYNIRTKLTSYYEHNKKTKLNYLLDCLNGMDIALVSEAGMPGLSDPGYELIRAAIDNNIKVTVVPGASAITVALSLSGLAADRFCFMGFLPRRKAERQKLLQQVASDARTVIVFEAPHRLLASLRDIQAMLGDRPIAVCRELTKIYEEVFRGKVGDAIKYFQAPRGEFTLVIGGAVESVDRSDTQLAAELRRLYEEGCKARESIDKISQQSGASKKRLYDLWIDLQKGE
jgi:16S rRNA (cytidine1402-2'-O)-methyltransferase